MLPFAWPAEFNPGLPFFNVFDIYKENVPPAGNNNQWENASYNPYTYDKENVSGFIAIQLSKCRQAYGTKTANPVS